MNYNNIEKIGIFMVIFQYYFVEGFYKFKIIYQLQVGIFMRFYNKRK